MEWVKQFLETIAGRYSINSGSISFNGKELSILPPEKEI